MYNNLDEMYEDLGLVMKHYTISYYLDGELQESEIKIRPVRAGSDYAEDISDAVNIGKDLLVDRCEFHGVGHVNIADARPTDPWA